MTCAMVVSSRSGNTQEVADAVRSALEARGAALSYCGCVSAADSAAAQAGAGAGLSTAAPASASDVLAAAGDADAVLAGFWTDKGDCAPELAEVLEGLHGKRVFLFGTAGFGGSEDYFAQILERVRAHLPQDAVYLGGAMCQGKMGPGVRARYEAMLAERPDDARVQGMIANFDAALAHPDADDLARIAAAACDAVLG